MANKIDFNVPFITETGDIVRRPAIDKTKSKMDQNGNLTPVHVVDADGLVVQEPVLVRELIAQVLNASYEGDEKLEFPVRAARGRLARKVSDGSKGSLKNYTTEELNTIKTLVAKVGSTPLITQLDDLIEGVPEAEVAA